MTLKLAAVVLREALSVPPAPGTVHHSHDVGSWVPLLPLCPLSDGKGGEGRLVAHGVGGAWGPAAKMDLIPRAVDAGEADRHQFLQLSPVTGWDGAADAQACRARDIGAPCIVAQPVAASSPQSVEASSSVSATGVAVLVPIAHQLSDAVLVLVLALSADVVVGGNLVHDRERARAARFVAMRGASCSVAFADSIRHAT